MAERQWSDLREVDLGREHGLDFVRLFVRVKMPDGRERTAYFVERFTPEFRADTEAYYRYIDMRVEMLLHEQPDPL